MSNFEEDAHAKTGPVEHAVERAKALRQEIASEAAAYSQSVGDAGKRTAVRNIDAVVASLQAAADELNSRNDGLARPIESVASRLDNIALHLEEQNLGELAEEASQFARHHPAAFLGGAVALGFLLGRTFRASPSRADEASGPERGPAS